uniref:Dihydrolipoamide acetyltransferase component of pyruvate dehydrogenase complex n=2 Tax=Corethron hystrix TaxID=216773 RepID=A0A7S1B714_9STRA
MAGVGLGSDSRVAAVNALSFFFRQFCSYPPHEIMGMPSLSPTMESGQISSWDKDEGDEFVAGDVLCQIETDKATVDFEAQDDGVIAKILVPAGPDTIACGEPILVTVEEAGNLGAFRDFSVEGAVGGSAPPPAPAAEPVAPPPTGLAELPATTSVPISEVSKGERIFASPLAKKLAAESSVDIATVHGTGPGGRVLAADILEYVPPIAVTTAAATAMEAGSPVTAPVVLPSVLGDGFTDYPLTAAATELAACLAHSKAVVPHYYLTVDVRLDAVLELRSQLNENLPEEEHITLNDFLVKSAASSMKVAPTANASWMDTAVRLYDDVHINVGIGQGDNLVAPVVKHANGTGLKGISDTMRSYEVKVAEGTLSAEDCAMGTFTIVNLGQYGIKSVAPIVNEPQACILGIGVAEDRVVPKISISDDDEKIYEYATVLTATLSCDHRVIDGAVGAQWLAAFRGLVEKPESLLL